MAHPSTSSVPGFGAGIESMLDIESITGIAGNIEAEFWGYKGKSPDNAQNEPYFKWLTDLAGALAQSKLHTSASTSHVACCCTRTVCARRAARTVPHARHLTRQHRQCGGEVGFWFWDTGGTLQANASDADVPKVFSTSYGEDEDSWSMDASLRMNIEFQKVKDAMLFPDFFALCASPAPRGSFAPRGSLAMWVSRAEPWPARCIRVWRADRSLTTLSSFIIGHITSRHVASCLGTSRHGTSRHVTSRATQAGVRGISLLYAAGDEGANCKGGKFVPETPGSSPWVTAVGGTTGSDEERAVGLSSGGFSNRWPQPIWQQDAVATCVPPPRP
jgi:hypothetical protein